MFSPSFSFRHDAIEGLCSSTPGTRCATRYLEKSTSIICRWATKDDCNPISMPSDLYPNSCACTYECSWARNSKSDVFIYRSVALQPQPLPYTIFERSGRRPLRLINAFFSTSVPIDGCWRYYLGAQLLTDRFFGCCSGHK